MTRREFLKGAAGFAVAACFDFFGLGALAAPKAESTAFAGPKLQDGLTLAATKDGADVFADGKLAFTVNTSGTKLLGLADGTRSLAALTAEAGEGNSAAAASFFLTLGKAGFLQNTIEVNLVETHYRCVSAT